MFYNDSKYTAFTAPEKHWFCGIEWIGTSGPATCRKPFFLQDNNKFIISALTVVG